MGGVAMLKFVLPITPTTQARPRVTVRGKFAHAYKTADQKANERSLEACLLQYQPATPLSGPVVLEFVAALPISRSDSKKTVQAKLNGEIAPTKKPDLDNLTKQLKDAMTRMQFWHDDSQVVCLRCDKIFAESGYWEVLVYEAVRRLGE